MATKVKYDFNPFGSNYANVKVSGDKRKEILEDLKDFIKVRILEDVGEGISPVTGKQWAGLSKEYKKKKAKEAGNTKANLELFGEMLDSLDVIDFGNGLRVTVSDDQMAKADGHNNFSGKSKLPERKFIPNAKAGEDFSKELKKEIIDIVESQIDDTES